MCFKETLKRLHVTKPQNAPKILTYHLDITGADSSNHFSLPENNIDRTRYRNLDEALKEKKHHPLKIVALQKNSLLSEKPHKWEGELITRKD